MWAAANSEQICAAVPRSQFYRVHAGPSPVEVYMTFEKLIYLGHHKELEVLL